jgi:hypothetical protein
LSPTCFMICGAISVPSSWRSKAIANIAARIRVLTIHLRRHQTV